MSTSQEIAPTAQDGGTVVIREPAPEGVIDTTLVCWRDTAGRVHESQVQTEIDTSVWVPKGDGSGYLHKVRTKTVDEVHREIAAIVGEEQTYGAAPFESTFVTVPGAEEYFSIALGVGAGQEWPAGRTIVYAVTGGSEGHYVHVDVLTASGHEGLLLGKTFHGADAAWGLARRVANLLGV